MGRTSLIHAEGEHHYERVERNVIESPSENFVHPNEVEGNRESLVEDASQEPSVSGKEEGLRVSTARISPKDMVREEESLMHRRTLPSGSYYLHDRTVLAFKNGCVF